MNRFYKTLICVLFAISLLSVKQVTTYDKVVGHWSYGDRYTFKFLKLKHDKTYNYVYKGCRGETTNEGIYSLKGDTIVLTNPIDSTLDQILFKGNLILTYSKDGLFTDFEPLERTKKRNKVSAYKECKRKERANRRAYMNRNKH